MKFIIFILLCCNLLYPIDMNNPIDLNVSKYSGNIQNWHESKKTIDIDNENENGINALIEAFHKNKNISHANQVEVSKAKKQLLKDINAEYTLLNEQEQIKNDIINIDKYYNQHKNILTKLLNENISKKNIFISNIAFDNNITKNNATKVSDSAIIDHVNNMQTTSYIKLFCDILFDGEERDRCLNPSNLYRDILDIVQKTKKKVQTETITLYDNYDGYNVKKQKQKMIIIYLINKQGKELEEHPASAIIDVNITNISTDKFYVPSLMHNSIDSGLKDNIFLDGLVRTKINNFILKAKTSEDNKYIYSAIKNQLRIIKNLLEEKSKQINNFDTSMNNILEQGNYINKSLVILEASCDTFIKSKESEKQALKNIDKIKQKIQYPYFDEEDNNISSADNTTITVLQNMNKFFKDNFLIGNYVQKKLYTESNFKITEHNISIKKSMFESGQIKNRLHRVDKEISKYGLGIIYTVEHSYSVNNINNFYIPKNKQCVNSLYFTNLKKNILFNINIKSEKNIENIISKIKEKEKKYQTDNTTFKLLLSKI